VGNYFQGSMGVALGMERGYMRKQALRKQQLVSSPPGEEKRRTIVHSVADLFVATLTSANYLVEKKIAELPLEEQHGIERLYGTHDHMSLVMCITREAADSVGFQLPGYTVEAIDTEHVPVPPKLVSFADLLEDISTIEQGKMHVQSG
jgi:hypothetical protein